MTSQRDAFWDSVYEEARVNRNIVLISADMGAPSLDKFRRDLPGQYVNAGIAEQNAALVAAGLALEGKRPFVYAIAPFVTLRILEFIRIEAAVMALPITFVGVGAGFSYEDSGPTHHLLEDISALRVLPNLRIYSVSDTQTAAEVGRLSCRASYPIYVRLDRAPLPNIYASPPDFEKGFEIIAEGDEGWIVSTGYMTHKALRVSKDLAKDGRRVGVIDIICIPFASAQLLETVRRARRLFVLEEHFLPGGLGGAIAECMAGSDISVPITRLGLDRELGYSYVYGGRERILAGYGLSDQAVAGRIRNDLAKAV